MQQADSQQNEKGEPVNKSSISLPQNIKASFVLF